MDKKNINYNVITLLLVLISDDSMIFGTNSQFIYFIIKYIFYFGMIISILIYMYKKEIKFTRNSMLLFLVLIILITITSIFNLDFQLGHLFKIIAILLGLLLSRIMTYDIFCKSLVSVMSFLSLFSLGTFFMEIIKLPLIQNFPIIINTAGNTYYNMFFSVIPLQNWGVPRNYGLFREPAIFIIYLSFALLIVLFVSKKNNFLYQILFVSTILTTRSTTGYIVMAVIYLFYFIKPSVNKMDRHFRFVVFIAIIGGAYYLINYTEILFSENKYIGVFNKFENLNEHIARFSSITINLEMFAINPLIGIGINKIEELYPILTFDRYGVISLNNTNTYLTLFSTYGLFFGLIWTYFLFRGFSFYGKRIGLVFTISLFLAFSGGNINGNIILFMIIFMTTQKNDKIRMFIST